MIKPSANNRSRRISRRFVALTVIFAFIHAVVLHVSGGIIASRAVERFHNLEVPETALERMCTMVTYVLIEPLYVLALATGLRRGWWVWPLSLLNSLLWGATFALIFLLVTSRQRPVQQA